MCIRAKLLYVSVLVKAQQQCKRKSSEMQLKGDLYVRLPGGRHGSKSRWTDPDILFPRRQPPTSLSAPPLTLLLVHIITVYNMLICFWLRPQYLSPSQSLGVICLFLSELNCSSAALFQLTKPYFELYYQRKWNCNKHFLVPNHVSVFSLHCFLYGWRCRSVSPPLKHSHQP